MLKRAYVLLVATFLVLTAVSHRALAAGLTDGVCEPTLSCGDSCVTSISCGVAECNKCCQDCSGTGNTCQDQPGQCPAC
jgi:hypothetical protein